ncbi:MAG: hypothetical protein AB7S26_01265 [Sandaracinaceae bacterium]
MTARSFDEVIAMSADELDRAMKDGHPIDEDVLRDREYDGVSLNLPGVVVKLTWLKFCKVFCRERDGSLRGWNCRVVQTPLSEPWELQLERGAPVTYGHYLVRPTAGYAMPRPYDAGLMLDYGLGKNPPLDPTRRVRDPIVAVNAGDSELLLGWSYVELGALRVGTPSYFVLRRGRPLSHRV